MDSGEQVHEKVAGQTFAVIGEAAPAEEARGVKGTLWRADQKLVPVDGFFAGIGGNGVDPGAARRIAIQRSFETA